MLRTRVGILLFVLTAATAAGQAVDNTASFRMVNSLRYVRLHYENDFFTGHDLYYTQGVNLEVVNPAFEKLFINRLFYRPGNCVSNFGISLEHNAYTPASITHTEILRGDRPFAADVFVKFFSFSGDSTRHVRFTSSFSAGVIGKAASGYTIQKTIHGWLNTTAPKGWNNQIANDVIINYEMGIEKNLWHPGNYFLVNGNADVRAGTLSDKLTAGIIVMVGKLNPAITSVFSGKRHSARSAFHAHFYAQPLVNVIACDATMQGGVFNRSSPYTLSFREVEHLTLQVNYGMVMNFHAVSVEYFKSAITREFKEGGNHRWGGLRIAVSY